MRVASGRFGRHGAGLLLAVLGLGLAQTTSIAPLDEETFSRLFSSASSQAGQVRWHYVTGGSGDVVVLLHGWPQTWFEWRDVMPYLAVESSPMQYARQFPGDLKTVSMVDTPIPGLTGWEGLRNQWPRWHWAFHSFPDLPEALVSGRERIYLNWFFQNFSYNKAVFSEARVDRYVKAYSKPSSLHAGFEYYRAFEKDAADNQDHASAKLTMPVLSIGGANSHLNKYVVDQLRAGTTRLTGDLAPQSGHWIPEEQPEWLARRLMEFIGAK